MNNFEKIRALNLDEMSEFIHRLKDCEDVDCDKCMLHWLCAIGICKDGIKQWLESEVRE